MNATRGYPPNGQDEFDRHHSIEHTYYNHDGVTVTDRWLTITGHRYDVSALDELRTVRGAYQAMVTATAGLAGVVIFAVIVSLPFYYAETAAWLGVLAVAIVPVVTAIVAWRTQPRPYELWADYRGRPVRLLRVPDEKTYGHVCRALIRAREAHPEQARVLPPGSLIGGRQGLPRDCGQRAVKARGAEEFRRTPPPLS